MGFGKFLGSVYNPNDNSAQIFANQNEGSNQVTNLNNPNYGAPQTNVSAGYQPIASQGAGYSGGADAGSTSPTIANNGFNWQQFGQNPTGYAMKQGLTAIGAGPGTTAGNWISNPIGTGLQKLFGGNDNSTPPENDPGASEPNVQDAVDASQINNAEINNSPMIDSGIMDAETSAEATDAGAAAAMLFA
jgi:hypothetical protein